MLKVSIITLFPDLFLPHLEHLPIKRAIDKKLIIIKFINLRDFAIDKRGTVDSPAYGGGPGMILRPEPIYEAVESVRDRASSKIVFLTPKGSIYKQKQAYELANEKHLILVCGRYEGIDQRVIDYYKKEYGGAEISVGEYVLSGGEVPAMLILESVARLIPGAITNSEALRDESFNPDFPARTEHPQYTRPEEWRGLKVPNILLSGDHQKIKDWKNLKRDNENAGT